MSGSFPMSSNRPPERPERPSPSLIDAYTEEEVRGETRTVLKLHPRLAPYKVAILPLSKKAELIEPASKLAADLRKHFMLEVDVTQSIGRRYRRQDEIGTPFCRHGRLRDSRGRSSHDPPSRHDGTGPGANDRGPLHT